MFCYWEQMKMRIESYIILWERCSDDKKRGDFASAKSPQIADVSVFSTSLYLLEE